MKKYEAMVMDDPHLPNLRWLRVTHNGVSYSTIRIDSNDEILQIISALQQSVQADGLCLYPGCDDIGWNGGFCRLHNPANTPAADANRWADCSTEMRNYGTRNTLQCLRFVANHS